MKTTTIIFNKVHYAFASAINIAAYKSLDVVFFNHIPAFNPTYFIKYNISAIHTGWLIDINMISIKENNHLRF
jgi:hypothetical protein